MKRTNLHISLINMQHVINHELHSLKLTTLVLLLMYFRLEYQSSYVLARACFSSLGEDDDA